MELRGKRNRHLAKGSIRQAEVAFDITPDAMNVIRRIVGAVRLLVEELNHKRRPLHTVGVRLARLVLLVQKRSGPYRSRRP